MDHFLSCDWGTTSFRLRLADTEQGRVLAEEISALGVAETFDLWQATGDPDKENKVKFYLKIIQQHIKKMEAEIDHSLKGVKLIISGMASSSIGFIDIPYSLVPLAVDGSGIKTVSIAASKDFDHDLLIISGVKTEDDVMRGEETQLIGCIGPGKTVKNELYIFPGTHSKHIRVKDDRIVDFKTYMTGEFFSLLSQKSILKNAVEPNDNSAALDTFKKGVRDSMTTNLLHSAFKVRTNQLFDVYTKSQNFTYLSGLLIGAELNDLKTTDTELINLVCGSNLERYYLAAHEEIGLSAIINKFPPQWVDEAVVRGQLKIGKQLKITA